jgi:(2S)-methylsuccinyl-CoA dehydrogenase
MLHCEKWSRLVNVAELAAQALVALEALQIQAIGSVRVRVSESGKLNAALIEREQRATHGLAWLATYIEAVRQLADYALRLEAQGRFGETERLLTTIGLGEYCAQIFGSIAMNQGETLRLADFGLSDSETASYRGDAITQLIEKGSTPQTRRALVDCMEGADGAPTIGDPGLDETFEAIRTEMRRFADAEVIPHAQAWHRANAYIPLEIIRGLAELGVFGLTIPEDYGGMGLGKVAMCVVSEELSRGYIGVGSLGTRSEIAAELILCGGTQDQKREFLPGLADGSILPTAVFTEPDTGSDLASLRTRAVRADLMTLLARTDPAEPGYRGLSMFLAQKPRGDDANPFPAKGMSGGEIAVLGYRGMKEYEIAFDGFQIPAGSLLGDREGQGFKQLMATFESARIQTAARAIGVAQSAMELGLRYARERVQFGKKLVVFPRVSDKLAMMAVEINIARQMTYFAARAKDAGRRCDLEAGMAKLIGARVAWAAADNSLQIHGGNGFALEYPISRVLCDARILNIFEGAAEIQAQVIARRLLEGTR